MRTPLALYAYPRGPRRAEVLDTLVMATSAGCRPARVPEAVNLLRHGLRARLGRPHSAGVVVLATLVAIIAGFCGAALANRLAWAGVPDLPAAPERAALAELITPGRPVAWQETPGGAPFTVVGDELTSRRIEGSLTGTPETERVAAYVAGLRARLSRAGWQVIEEYPTSPRNIETGAFQNESTALTARNDRLVLEFEDYYDATYRESSLSLIVYRAEPTWATALTFAAGLSAALAGWLLLGWASRRTEGRSAASLLATCATVLGLLLMTPALFLGASYLRVLSGDYLPDLPFWLGLEPTNEFGGLAVPAGVVFAAGLLIAALCRPAAGEAHRGTAQSTALK
jgi:hypothetical protein